MGDRSPLFTADNLISVLFFTSVACFRARAYQVRAARAGREFNFKAKICFALASLCRGIKRELECVEINFRFGEFLGQLE